MRFRILFLGSFLVALLAVCIALIFAHRARENEAAQRGISQRRARLESEIQTSARTLSESQRTQEALQRELAPAAPRSTAKSVTAPEVQPDFMKIALANDINLQRMALENEKRKVQADLGRYLQKLGFGSGEIDRMINAILDHRGQRSDIDGAALTQRLSTSDPVITALREKADAALEATEREIMGDDRYQKFQEHERMDAVRRQVVNTLVGNLAMDGLPLTEEQAERLTQALADSNTSYRAGKAADAPWAAVQATADPLWRGPLPDTFDWASARQQARAILTPEQFPYFDQQIQMYEGIQLINMVVRATDPKPAGR